MRSASLKATKSAFRTLPHKRSPGDGDTGALRRGLNAGAGGDRPPRSLNARPRRGVPAYDALNRFGALLDAAHQAELGGTPSPDTRRPAEEA